MSPPVLPASPPTQTSSSTTRERSRKTTICSTRSRCPSSSSCSDCATSSRVRLVFFWGIARLVLTRVATTGYTQFGGLRPFGVSFLYAGWDRHYGFQLYMSDPSGNYGGWRATCIGANNQAAQSILKSSFETNDNLDIQKALALAVKVLSKTMDSTMLTPDRCTLCPPKLVDPQEANLFVNEQWSFQLSHARTASASSRRSLPPPSKSSSTTQKPPRRPRPQQAAAPAPRKRPMKIK